MFLSDVLLQYIVGSDTLNALVSLYMHYSLMLWWTLPFLLVFSWAFTGALRRYALTRSLIDVPNARSSHSTPTPRSGGIGFVLSFLAALPLFAMFGAVEWHLVWALTGGGAGVALIGFIDDRSHVAVRWRLLGHFSCVVWALFWIDGLPPLDIFGFSLNLGWVGNILAVFYLVWMLNLYNFMDGIDGIASVEAVSSCVAASLIYWLAGYGALVWVPVLLAMPVLGFMYWNFPRAKIFMGDVGSGFLGVVIGVISLYAARHDSKFLWVWLILLGVFIVDATFTLVRRFLMGEKIYEAHRSHAYQVAARRLGSHFSVTMAVLVINVFWLFPIALGVGFLELDGSYSLILAYVPLVVIAYRYHAGVPEKSS